MSQPVHEPPEIFDCICSMMSPESKTSVRPFSPGLHEKIVKERPPIVTAPPVAPGPTPGVLSVVLYGAGETHAEVRGPPQLAKPSLTYGFLPGVPSW